MQARFDFGADHHGAWLFRSPEHVVVARSLDEVPACMAAVDQALQEGLYAAGYVAYEAAPAFDPALTAQAPSSVPLAYFGLFRTVERASALKQSVPPAPVAWTPALPASEHARGVAAIREAIADGDTYQINYTFRLKAALEPAAVEPLYRHLARAERVPYAAHLDLGDWQVLSLSPELFFQLDGTRLVTRPMKGTAPRGRWAEEDAARGDGLRRSEKNRAENIMIVDLCRNDLSRVCEVGSVRASSLCEAESYPTVWQMVSTVEGDVKPGTRLSDIFAALFPAGSITGAPKSSSMRLIASLEHASRGIYCGAIGFASPDGRATFNVAIRTMTIHTRSGEAEYGVGGGITWDSVAADEHAEALSKAACLEVRQPFSLIETMRFEDGAVVRLDRHLARLSESAAFFEFACDLAHVRTTLESHLTSYLGRRLRVRLLLQADGRVLVESRDFERAEQATMPFALGDEPVDGEDRFLCHKTTRRQVYDRHRAAHPDAFDVLLWNERRELTEFSRGNLIVELDGRLWTPPRASGLLAGVFRGELLDAGTIHERVLMVDDLLRCSRLWCINSLREWVPVQAGQRTINSAPMSRVRWVWLVLFLVVLLRTAWLGDDALITLRTVLNFTHGYGLTFNLTERVQAFTHPLWLALLTIAYWVVGNIFYATFALSIAVSLLVFAVVLRAARSASQVWIAAGVMLTSRAFVDYSTSGLENPLTALVAVGTLAWAAREVRVRSWLAVTWLGVSAAYLTRPDAVLLVLPVAIWAAFQVRPRRTAMLSVALGLIPALLWTMFAVVYYGFPFPNTAYAKLSTDIHVSERVWQGLLYLLDSINRDPITLTAIGVALVVVAIERSRDAWLGAVGLVASLAYVVWIGGDFMSGRFLAVPVLVAVWLLARAQRIQHADWRPVLVVLAAAAIASPQLPLRSNSAFNAAEPLSGMVDERGVYFQTWSLVKADRLAFAEPEWPRWNGVTKPEYVLDTCGLMGAAGLEWGPRTYLLDECALADPLMARLPAVWNEEWRPGHYRRMIPDGYRESVAQDGNLIRDRGLAQYYAALRTIVRGTSLWSADRLGVIWRMNLGRFNSLIDRSFYRSDGSATSLDSLSHVQPDGTPWDAPGSRTFLTQLAVMVPDQTGRRVLDVSLDADDRYRLTFLRRNRIVGAVVVDAVSRDRRQPGLASHVVMIPERARKLGFDTIVVVSVAGDGRKAVGHLLLDGDPATAAELGRRFGAAGR